MVLSKAFDTVNYELLIPELEVYGFSHCVLSYVLSYLKRSQRVGLDNTFRTWEEIITGVPQGLILGPLLFNTFLNGIFYSEKRLFLSNNVDNNNLYDFSFKFKKN